jgi:uncharacterized protein YhbP (UPF0306 family)
MANATLRKRIESFLGKHHVMTLATSSYNGPWAAAVFYASDRLDLYFVSWHGSRHCADFETGSTVAAAIHAECEDWRRVKGVQLEGRAKRLTGKAREQARKLYGSKFPQLADPGCAPAQVSSALAKSQWYRLVPRRLRFIDNSRGLGHREELVVS